MVLLSDDPSVKVAARKITQHLGNIYYKQINAVQLWNGQKIKGVSNGVGKATKDEDRDAEE